MYDRLCQIRTAVREQASRTTSGSRPNLRLAIDMIEPALDAGVPAKWRPGTPSTGSITGCAALWRNAESTTSSRPRSPNASWSKTDPSWASRSAPMRRSRTWLRPCGTRSAGDVAKGVRDYAWARVRINGAQDGHAEHWLLARRNRANPSGLAYFICNTPKRVALAQIAGVRWWIEETFQTSKGEPRRLPSSRSDQSTFAPSMRPADPWALS